MVLRNRISQLSTGGLLLAAWTGVRVVGQSAPPDAAPVPPGVVDAAPIQTVQGAVDGFNRDPHGRLNSVVIKTPDGHLDQFNIPPDLEGAVTHIVPEGLNVTVVGSPERTVGDRTIYRLSKITGPDGKASITAPMPGAPEPVETVEGTVQRLNMSPRGEVDGAMLDDGDFVHTGVEAGAGLKAGIKLTATGTMRTMANGHRAVEATVVNGRPVPRPPVRPGPHPTPGPEAGHPPVPPKPDQAFPQPDQAPPIPPAQLPR